MARNGAKILVIDDDAVALVAIADVLQGAGYQVVERSSPIGVTKVIVDQQIDLMVIDINMPVMQGDNVVRLLSSWDRLKEVPVVIISGAGPERLDVIRSGMPEVRIVTKAEITDKLAPAVREALDRVARARDKQVEAESEPAPRPPGGEMTTRFLEELASTSGEARKLWHSVSEGDCSLSASTLETLRRLHGQAQLLGLEDAAKLIAGVSRVLTSQTAGKPPPPFVTSIVESATSALEVLKRSATGEFALAPAALIRDLDDAVTELSVLDRVPG